MFENDTIKTIGKHDTILNLNEILIEFDINDKNKRMEMYHELNGEFGKRLGFVIIKKNGKYYFIDANESTQLIKHLTDDKQLSCPCCMMPVYHKNGFNKKLNGKQIKIDSTFCHYSDEKNKTCELYNGYYKKDELYNSEGFNESNEHKKAKQKLYFKINSEGLNVNITTGYRYNFESKKHERITKDVKLISADIEKKIKKKDKYSNGYIPDITAYTESGETIAIEITVTHGKTLNEYIDVFRNLGIIIIEYRVKTGKYQEIYNPKLEQYYNSKFGVKTLLSIVNESIEEFEKDGGFIIYDNIFFYGEITLNTFTYDIEYNGEHIQKILPEIIYKKILEKIKRG